MLSWPFREISSLNNVFIYGISVPMEDEPFGAMIVKVKLY